jgi:hypothetical protein
MKIKESCTWKDETQCRDCVNRDVLLCRWSGSDLFIFFCLVMPGMLGAIAGTVLIWMVRGAWWPFAAYLLFFPVVLGIAEARFLCCHCPYYAQEGRILHCLANHGLPKIWRYHPEPMNRLEKGLMIALIAVFLLLLPASILGYDIWFFAGHIAAYGDIALIAVISLTAVTAMSELTAAAVMAKHVCSACVNFSCPFNGVDKAHVDAYLEKNPVMRKAWEEKGYRLGAEKEDAAK